MIKSKNFYEILQVQYNAEVEVINAAYKNLCKKYHPDICKGKSSKEIIVKLNIAYDTLKDQQKRSQYDKNLAISKSIIQPINNVNHECEKTMISYISCLKNEEYNKAYELISAIDKKYITLKKFVEWQKEVSNLYVIGNFKVEYFNKNEEYQTKSNKKVTVYEFDITVREKQLSDNTIQNFSFSKMVIREKGTWKVLLDFQEVDSLINKFYLQSMKKNTEKNIVSFKQFIDIVRLESERYNRYQRNYALAIFDLVSGAKTDKIRKDYILDGIDVVQENIRTSDFMCLYKNEYILIMLPETDGEGVNYVCEKLYIKLKSDKKLKRISKTYRYGMCVYKGENYKKFISSCLNLMKNN